MPRPAPRPGKFRDGSGKKKALLPPQSRRYPPTVGQGSGTGKLAARMSSIHVASADGPAALGRVGSQGPHLGERGQQHLGAASHGLQAPSRGEHPGQDVGRGGTERGSVLGGPAGNPGDTIPAAGMDFSSLSSAQAGPRCWAWGPLALPTCFTQDSVDKTLEAGFSSGWINLPFSF